MTFSISWGYCAENSVEAETIDAAIIVALTALHERPPGQWYPPRIVNLERYDCDDGRICDGLDEDERDRVMAAGL